MTKPMITAALTFKLDGLPRAIRLLKPGSPLYVAMLKQWAARYRSFAQRRFLTLSRGGSDGETGDAWPELKKATKDRRARQSVRKRRKSLNRQIRKAQQQLKAVHEQMRDMG